jgi:UDP-N-acetylglucosamine 2-epimerase
MEKSQTLTRIMEKSLSGLSEIFSETSPDLVLVHGDTSTTLAGALAAFYSKIPVGHVEAGLRTYDRYSPYPEEMNRRLVGQLATMHFAPTETNAENLRKENIRENIFVTGNTVIDALSTTVRNDYIFKDKKLRKIDFTNKRMLLVTAHRRENYGEPLYNIMRALKRLANDNPDVHIVYPLHLSPVVRNTANEVLSDVPGVSLIEPVTVDEMHNLMNRAYIVLTDSGGLQEEAPALGKPVLVLRRETERPEAVAAGTVKLAGVNEEAIYSMANELLHSETEYEKMAHAVNPYGDGRASERIVSAIIKTYINPYEVFSAFSVRPCF